MTMIKKDVVIIGAGPAGSVAACLLQQKGYSTQIIERSVFPRFSIGESLLPQCLMTLDKAGCLDAIEAAGFQVKHGATFQRNGIYKNINFSEKFTPGPGTAFHVERSRFDQILTECAEQAGSSVLFDTEVTDVKPELNHCVTEIRTSEQKIQQIQSRFVLDASGFVRFLPKLLGIDKPSELSPKSSLFSHVQDNIRCPCYSRSETLITTHPVHKNVWYWLISFTGGRSSVGVVGEPDFVQPFQEQGIDGLKAVIGEDPELSRLLADADYDTQPYSLNAWSGNVTQFAGDGYAIIGNAGEFLDPVFSSGVTVALQSADLAVDVIDKIFKGEAYDWLEDFEQPLKVGINTFKSYVENWYSGGFQDVIYSDIQEQAVKPKIASILAGYAWDTRNPFVAKPERGLQSLIQICQN